MKNKKYEYKVIDTTSLDTLRNELWCLACRGWRVISHTTCKVGMVRYQTVIVEREENE